MRDITGRHRDYEAHLAQWQRCRAVIAGQDAVKAEGERYLPRLPGQSAEHYRQYLLRAAFFNAAGNSLSLYTSMAFSKAPAIRGMEEDSELLEDCDLRGTPFVTLLERVLYEVIAVGRCGVLLDYEGTITEGMSLADAAREHARPYLALYEAESITDWHAGRRGGRMVADRVVLRERAEDTLGEERIQYRELILTDAGCEVRLWREEEGKPGGTGREVARQVPRYRGAPLPFLPFYFCDPEYGGMDCAKPPLLDLVDANLSHFRTMADLENGRMFCGLSTPVFAGFSFAPGERVRLGSMEGIVSPSADAKAYYLKTDGSELMALERAAAQKEQWMVRLGSGLMDEYRTGAESTETVRMRRAGANATLASMAQAVSGVMTKVLKMLALWNGGDAEAVSVQLLTEYLPASVGPEEIRALIEAVQTGNLRRVDFLSRLKVAGVLSQDLRVETVDQELARAEEVRASAAA